MTFVVFSSRAGRRLRAKRMRKCSGATTFVNGTLLAALIACTSIAAAHAGSNASVLFLHSDRAPDLLFARQLVTPKLSPAQELASRLGHASASPIVNILESFSSLQDVTGSVPDFRFNTPPPTPAIIASMTLPATVEVPVEGSDRFAHIEASDGLAPAMIVGIASMYNPNDPDDAEDSGGHETASGELYDETGWTAAIRIDLRARFGGVSYGNGYQPAYALVEAGDKRAIVKINDVGPLAPGRVIDLNERAMQYFDPTLQLGLLNGVRVTPLAGTNWTAGPVGDDGETINLTGQIGPATALAAPHFVCELHDHAQFRPLLILGKDVALFGRGEATLRRQAELVE
jgi:rare lipoprotein A